MKKYAAIALLMISAAIPPRYEAQRLIHEEHKLNSNSRPGGTAREIIKINIPPHVDYLVYSIVASPTNPISELKLHAQLHDHITKEGIGMSISSAILNDLFVPQGDGVTDVLIMKDAANANNYIKKLPSKYMGDYSRKSVANAIVGMPITYSDKPTTLYMCLRNPGAFNAEFVTVEVDAMQRL